MKTTKKATPLMKELSASEITKEALLRLKAQGFTVWRQNNLTIGRRKNIATPGIPDIIGYTSNGHFVGCEVKKIGDKFSKEQIGFLNGLIKGGGVALYAIQVGSEVKIKSFEEIQLKETKVKPAIF
jgi:VRR-NUC domain.